MNMPEGLNIYHKFLRIQMSAAFYAKRKIAPRFTYLTHTNRTTLKTYKNVFDCVSNKKKYLSKCLTHLPDV